MAVVITTSAPYVSASITGASNFGGSTKRLLQERRARGHATTSPKYTAGTNTSHINYVISARALCRCQTSYSASFTSSDGVLPKMESQEPWQSGGRVSPCHMQHQDPNFPESTDNSDQVKTHTRRRTSPLTRDVTHFDS